jgi:3-oxoacyl-[acyl-carrier protein] reductase
VTGGSRGIGRAISVLMGSLGARVGVNYARDAAAAEATVSQIHGAGGQATALRADVSDLAAAEALVAEAEARLGPLDVLVVNHGIWRHAPLADLTPERWSETMRVNLDGAYAVCRAASRRMVPRQRGAIVLLASTAGQRGEAEYAHYAATRGAIIAFTKSLARSWPRTESA